MAVQHFTRPLQNIHIGCVNLELGSRLCHQWSILCKNCLSGCVGWVSLLQERMVMLMPLKVEDAPLPNRDMILEKR